MMRRLVLATVLSVTALTAVPGKAQAQCRIWYMDCTGSFTSTANRGKWLFYSNTDYGTSTISCSTATAMAGRLQANYRGQGYNVYFQVGTGNNPPNTNPCGSANPTPPPRQCTTLYYVGLTCPWGASGYLGGYRTLAEAQYYGNLWVRTYGCRIIKPAFGVCQ